MGILFLLFIIWPVVTILGMTVIITPYIPYILMLSAVFWFTIGIVFRHIFVKHELYEAGEQSGKVWFRYFTVLLKWLVRIDIIGNAILFIVSLIMSIKLAVSGNTPFLPWGS